MSNRFSFRVYSYEQKRMIYSWNYTSIRDFLYGALIDHRFFGKGLFVTMSSIGRKDNNGILIYEGDILKNKYNDLYVVEYDNDITGFKPFNQFDISENGYFDEEIEIIGNVYENRNLLESEAK